MIKILLTLAFLLLVAGIRTRTTYSPATSCPKSPRTCTFQPPLGDQGRTIESYINSYAAANNLTSVLYRVTQNDGETVLVSGGYGTSLTNIPVQAPMSYRNGNIAYAYMGNLLFLLQEAGKLRLTDPAMRYLPEIMNWPYGSESITLENLAKSSSGIRDYVPNPNFLAELNGNPFQYFTPQHLIDIGFAAGPLLYVPGTAFSYAHTNYMLLGLALANAGGESLDKLLDKYVIKPLNLPNTAPALTTEEPEPVLHTYSHERDVFEETTYWNPSWFSAPGSVVTTNICDVSTSAVGIGKGCLLSPSSYAQFVAFTNYTLPPDCPPPVCHVFNKNSTKYFGVAVQLDHDWVFQEPSFGGTGQIMAYLPSAKLSVAIMYSGGPFTNDSIQHGEVIWKEIAAQLTPNNIPF